MLLIRSNIPELIEAQPTIIIDCRRGIVIIKFVEKRQRFPVFRRIAEGHRPAEQSGIAREDLCLRGLSPERSKNE